MRRLSSKLTFRISISTALVLIAIAAMFASGLQGARSSAQAGKRFSVQVKGKANPYVILQQGRELEPVYTEPSADKYAIQSAGAGGPVTPDGAQPLSLATGDFNIDGYPDLVSGYRNASGGMLTLYKGNQQAFSPTDPAVIDGIVNNNQFPEPFLRETIVFQLPVAPDFIGAGDFNRDNKIDLVAAARGDNALYLLAGDGLGGFITPERLELPGAVTAMTAGDINLEDGAIDLAVGINTFNGSSVLVYEGKESLLEATLIEHAIPAEARSLAIGRLDDDRLVDLAIVASGQVFVLHGSDQSGAVYPHDDARAGQIEAVSVAFTVNAIALGEFIWDRDSRTEMAMLADDGTVHILARGELDTRPFTAEEMAEKRRQLEGIRQRMERAASRGEVWMPPAVQSQATSWSVVEDVQSAPDGSLVTQSAGVGDGASQPVLLSTRISSLPSDDLIVMGAGRRQLKVVYREGAKEGEVTSQAAERESVELESDGEIAAVLPMRVNVMGQPGLVLMSKGGGSPLVFVPQSHQTIVVNTASDTVDANIPNGTCADAGGNCSLRAAIQTANAHPGTDLITFAAGINPTLTITSGGGTEQAAATGDLDINSSLTITGNNPTVISTNYTNTCGDCKVFGVNQPGTNNGISVSMTGITIQNGFNDGTNFSGSFFETGGGIDFFMTGSGNNHSMSNVTVTNNRTQNGVRSHGGGINVDSTNQAIVGGASAGTISFTSVTITNNTAQNDGGGGIFLAADIHTATMTNCVVTGNTCTNGSGGGIWIGHSFGGTVTISGASGSASSNSGTQGGGISVGRNQVTNISQIAVNTNTATGTVGQALGGGIVISTLGAAGVTGSTTLNGLTINNNDGDNGANAGGGGVFFGGFYPATITNCTITNNISDTGGGVLNGGSTATPGATLAISGGSITGNTATVSGGGFAAIGTGSPQPSSVTTFNNTMIGGTGAGQPNTAPTGGGIANTQTSSTTVTGNSIAGNTATGGSGGGILNTNTASITLNGVTVDSNSSTTGGDGLHMTGGTFTGQNTINFNGGDSINIAGGTFTSTAGTMNLTGNFIHTAGTFAANGGTVVFNGTGAQSLNGIATETFNNLTTNKSNTLTVGGSTTTLNSNNFTITAGTFNAGTATTINVSGNWTNNGTFTPQTGTVVFNGNNNTQTLAGTTTFNNLTINHTGTGNVTASGSTLTVTSLLRVQAGTFISSSTYNNVQIDAGATLQSDGGTINVSGNWTNNGTFTPSTGTVIFNGAASQTISGSSTTTFNNMTDANTAAALLVNSNINANGTLTINASAILTPGATNIIGGSGTLTGNGTAQVTRIAAVADFLTQYTIANKTLTNLTVDYSGAGNQTVNNTPAYGHLRISGSGIKSLQGTTNVSGNLTIAAATLDATASNHALNVAGNWTNNATFTPQQGTVTFNGSSGTQLLTGNTTFFDLTLNNSGATTDFGSTTTTIGNNLTTTAGTMDGGTSTIIFTGVGDGTGAISGAIAKNFNNLQINNGATISNTTGGNTTIENDYTNNGTFTQAAALTTTFAIGADGNHSFSGNGSTTFGNVTINSANTVNAGSHNINVAGAAFTVTGTFNGDTGTVTFNGAVAQAITGDGAKNFGGLTINNAMGVTLNNGAAAVDASVSGALTLTTDLTIAAGAILQQSGTSAGVGDAIGTVRRTDLGMTARAFGNPFNTISIESGTPPTQMDFTLVKMAPPDLTTAVLRTYTLTPTGGAGISATVKLHYLDSELNGNMEAKLALWRKNGTWSAQGRTGAVDLVNNAVMLSGVSQFSDWALAAVEPPTITKAFGASSIPLGGVTSLTFTITNPNTSTGLTGINFSDNMPAGLQVANPAGISATCSGTWNATPGDTTLNFGGGTLAANSSCTLTVNVTGTTPGDKNNTTNAIVSTEAGTGATSNTATLSVVAPPTISKAFGAASIPLNGTTTLTFTLTNPAGNTVAQTGVAFTDNLPAGLVVADTPGVVNNCGSGTVTANAGDGTISYSGGTLAVGQTCTIVVNVKGTTAGDKNNTSDAISSTEGGTGATSNTATVTVVAPPTISKAFGAASIPLNGTTTLTFTLTNPAANTVAQTGVAFTDNLPAGLVVADTPGVVNNCGSGTVTANAGAGTISYTGGTLAVGQTCTIVVNVKGTTEGAKNNTTDAISSTEGGTGATSNTATVTVASPPTISKAFGAMTIPVGGVTTLTFTITNPNAGITLNGISFSDNLPAGLQVANPAGISATCSGTWNATPGDTTLNFGGGTLAAGQSCTLTVNITGTTAGVKNNTTNAISSTEGGTGATSNTATITVVGPPTISKAFGASSIPLGGTTTLTFTLTNPNSAPLTGVAFTDNLPAGLVVADTPGVVNNCGSGTVTANAGAGTISYSGGSLTASQTCTIVVNVKGTTAGDKNNTTDAITSTETGPGATSNTATVTVVAPPTIAKIFGAPNIPLNGTTTLTFTITNPAANTIAQTGVAFTDNLPAGLVVADTPGVVNNCGSGTVTANAGAGTISYTGGTIGINSSCTIVVNVKGTTPGVKNNTTEPISSTEGGTGATSNTASIAVANPPTISKAFGVANIPVGGTTTLTFTLSNTNPSLALTGVSFTDNLPAGLVVAATPNIVNNCGSGTVTAMAGSGTISYSGGSFAASQSCTISVDVTGTTAGVKNNTTGPISSIETGDGGTSNTATIEVVAPPTISKAFGAMTIPLNGTTTLTFTINNPNTLTALSGIAFTDNLPAGLVVADTPGVVNNCGSGTVTANAGAGTISYTGGTLAANSSCTIVVNVKGTTAGAKNNTTDAISATESGTGATSNTATVTVISPPTIAKMFGATSIALNGTTTLTFTITNPNLGDALSGIAFTDNLPAGLVVADTPGVVNNCGSGTVTANAGAGTISYTGGTLAANSSCTIVVNVKGTTEGVKNNTTDAISSTNGGTGATSNTATLAVAGPPTISKAFGAASIPLNGTTTLTFTLTNNNTTVGVTGVAFTDNLPAGLVVADTPGVVNNCGSGTVTANAGAGTISYTGGTLAAGQSCTIVVNVKGTTAGDKNNTTDAITSTETGPGATSNTATLSVVAPPTISKAFGAASIPLNGTTTLTFTLTNPAANTVAQTGVAFTDNLPAGLVVADTPGVINNCGSGTVTANAGAGTISYSGGSLAVGQTCTIVVNVKGTTAGDKNNTSNAISSTEGGTGAASNTATVTVVAPPTISKAFGAASIPLNGTTTLTFTLTNPAANTVAQTGVAFTDNLPAGLVVADTPGVVNNCGSGTVVAVAGTGTISYSGGTLAVGQTCTIVVNVKGTTQGPKNNTTGNVSSSNGGTGNTASATLQVNSPPVAKCKNVTVTAGADCKANASIDDGSFDPDMGDTITLTQTPPGPYMLGDTLVTLTVTDNNGAMSQCQATVTVVDQTPPTITCPADITTVTNMPNQAGVVVNYATPSVENGMVADNCAIQSVVCSPASGSVFAVGTTMVTCTATDTSGNTASCTFKVTTFDVCIEDDSNPANVILINSFTGDYVFCCGNLKLTGKGRVNKKGATIILSDNKNDRRVSAQVSSNTVGGFRGAVTLQSPVGQTKCNFVDDDNRNNACNCSAP